MAIFFLMFGCLWLANSFRVFVGVFGLLLTAFCTVKVSFASWVSTVAGVFGLCAISHRMCSCGCTVKVFRM